MIAGGEPYIILGDGVTHLIQEPCNLQPPRDANALGRTFRAGPEEKLTFLIKRLVPWDIPKLATTKLGAFKCFPYS